MSGFLADLPVTDRLAEIRREEGRATPCDAGQHDWDFGKSPSECRRCGRKNTPSGT